MKELMSGPSIEEFCQQWGYTNETLASELEVSRATIFNWKKDKRALPRLVSLALRALQSDPQLRNTNLGSEKRPAKQHRRSTHATKED